MSGRPDIPPCACCGERCGRADVSMLQAADRLRAVVAIPGRTGADFEAALRRELDTMPLENPASISVEVGAQRMLRARVRTVIGHDVEISGLRPWASLVLQAHGLGARRHMGAGVFTEAR